MANPSHPPPRRLLSCVTIIALVAFSTAGCRHPSASRDARSSSTAGEAVELRVVTDEAEAALAILEAQEHGAAVDEALWRRLFESEGYRSLARRETAMRRPFTDSSFRAFLTSDTLRRRATALRRALDGYRRVDASAAAARALAYLPPGSRIRANFYPLIKPRTNTFVFTIDSSPSVFKYIDPAESAEVAANTLAHELHHIGYGTACPTPAAIADPRLRMARTYVHAFGEGVAMLAAAGGPDTHPHEHSAPADRARWDRDTAALEANLRQAERFFVDVLDGRVTGDSIAIAAQPLYGEQGPWYTVGWRMAAEVERARGRRALVATLCDPRRLLRAYNEVAAAKRLPRFPDALLARLDG